MPPPLPSSRALTLGLVLSTVLAHLGWAALDGRVPRDPGLYYKQVPALWAWLHGAPPRPEAGLWRPGAWMELLIAAAMLPTGPSSFVVRALDAAWVGLAVLGAASVGRCLGGARAGLAAAALVASLPVLVFTGRTSWIHVPEAALALGMLAAPARDPALAQARSALALSLLGALAISLRPSGLVWAGSLLLFAAWGAWRGRAPGWKSRLALALAGPALASPLALQHIGGYLAGKAASRPRYAASLPSIPEQGLDALGLVALILLVAVAARRASGASGSGNALCVFSARRLLLAWLGLGLALALASRAGVDNFPLGFIALAILAAAALTRAWPRGGPALALGTWLLTTTLPWVPAPGPTPLPATGPLAFARVFDRYGQAEVRALLDAACGPTPPRGCLVMADQGLYLPYGEEPGFFELFLAREERVNLLWAAVSGGRPRRRLDALVTWDCGAEAEAAWDARYPTADATVETIRDHAALEVAWTRALGGGCSVTWWTPQGRFRAPEAAPTGPGAPG